MSFTYIAEIMSNKDVVESTTTSNMTKAVDWANDNAISGDQLLISEGYTCSDGIVDKHDLLMTWRMD